MSINEQMRGAVLRFNGSIFCQSHAKAFLRELEPRKDNTERLFSWLVPYGPAAIAWAVAALHTQYQHDISQWFREIDQPLADTPPAIAGAIAKDVPRTIDWFRRLGAERWPLPPDDVTSMYAHRILCALYPLDREQFSCVQGFDRFVFVCYILALMFTAAAALPADVAEAIAFRLTAEVLKLPQVGDIIGQRKMRVFNRIDDLVRRRAPAIAAEIDRNGSMRFIYGLKWHMLLFADEHPFDGILNIWDAAIVRSKRIDAFVVAVAVEHVTQVKWRKGDQIVDAIQHFTAWDKAKLLRDSTEAYESRLMQGVGSLVVATMFTLGIVAIRVFHGLVLCGGTWEPLSQELSSIQRLSLRI
jgi:hypothetical protein